MDPTWLLPSDAPEPPVRTEIHLRTLYEYLVNAEEHPGVLPLAYNLVRQRLDASDSGSAGSRIPNSISAADDVVDVLIRRLMGLAPQFTCPWRQRSEDLTRRQ